MPPSKGLTKCYSRKELNEGIILIGVSSVWIKCLLNIQRPATPRTQQEARGHVCTAQLSGTQGKAEKDGLGQGGTLSNVTTLLGSSSVLVFPLMLVLLLFLYPVLSPLVLQKYNQFCKAFLYKSLHPYSSQLWSFLTSTVHNISFLYPMFWQLVTVIWGCYSMQFYS